MTPVRAFALTFPQIPLFSNVFPLLLSAWFRTGDDAVHGRYEIGAANDARLLIAGAGKGQWRQPFLASVRAMARSAKGDQVGKIVWPAQAKRHDVMHVQGALVLRRCLAALLAHLISRSNLMNQARPFTAVPSNACRVDATFLTAFCFPLPTMLSSQPELPGTVVPEVVYGHRVNRVAPAEAGYFAPFTLAINASACATASLSTAVRRFTRLLVVDVARSDGKRRSANDTIDGHPRHMRTVMATNIGHRLPPVVAACGSVLGRERGLLPAATVAKTVGDGIVKMRHDLTSKQVGDCAAPLTVSAVEGHFCSLNYTGCVPNWRSSCV